MKSKGRPVQRARWYWSETGMELTVEESNAAAVAFPGRCLVTLDEVQDIVEKAIEHHRKHGDHPPRGDR